MSDQPALQTCIDPIYSDWKVAYANFTSPVRGDKDWCVFSGIKEKGYRQSSINAAEQIIDAIVAKEGLDIHHTHFFDLQTAGGYNGTVHGVFVFDWVKGEVKNGKFHGPQWQPMECPRVVFESFKQCIGEYDFMKSLRLEYPNPSEEDIKWEQGFFKQIHDLMKDQVAKELVSGDYRVWKADEARKAGYRFSPRFRHAPLPSMLKGHSDNQVIVDLVTHEHLMAQCVASPSVRLNLVQPGGPRRFSLWEKAAH